MSTYANNTTIKVSGGGVIDATYTGGSPQTGNYFTTAADEYAILNIIEASGGLSPGGDFTVRIGAAEIIQLSSGFSSVSTGGQSSPDSYFYAGAIYVPPSTSVSYDYDGAGLSDDANFKAIYTKFKNSVP